ncbi:hypothetical protein FISHEDRAFT_78922 [Fistulina hepatica ATCC 64428]|uniref:Uncharacterized protein n=1 Tax=Fistulina hepatica ATCC 64428 TaxID=1128425 RepID=A0A0D6ZZQ3_9AGAR|nr:hypothetical protein FISHEDRAFT_78922 [Fistulina hepatica ATCC 64428]
MHHPGMGPPVSNTQQAAPVPEVNSGNNVNGRHASCPPKGEKKDDGSSADAKDRNDRAVGAGEQDGASTPAAPSASQQQPATRELMGPGATTHEEVPPCEYNMRPAYDPRAYLPQYDPRVYQPRYDPRAYAPQHDLRAYALQYDSRAYDPRAYDPCATTYDPRCDPRYDPRARPLYDPRYYPDLCEYDMRGGDSTASAVASKEQAATKARRDRREYEREYDTSREECGYFFPPDSLVCSSSNVNLVADVRGEEPEDAA